MHHLQRQLHSLGDSIFWEGGLHQGDQLALQKAPLRADGVIVLAEPRHDHEVQGEVGGDDATDPLLLQFLQAPQLCNHMHVCPSPPRVPAPPLPRPWPSHLEGQGSKPGESSTRKPGCRGPKCRSRTISSLSGLPTPQEAWTAQPQVHPQTSPSRRRPLLRDPWGSLTFIQPIEDLIQVAFSIAALMFLPHRAVFTPKHHKLSVPAAIGGKVGDLHNHRAEGIEGMVGRCGDAGVGTQMWGSGRAGGRGQQVPVWRLVLMTGQTCLGFLRCLRPLSLSTRPPLHFTGASPVAATGNNPALGLDVLARGPSPSWPQLPPLSIAQWQFLGGKAPPPSF